MKSFRTLSLFAIAVLLCSIGITSGHTVDSNRDDEFSVKQYNEFHELLHPLQHEALPKKDFARIRTKSMELVKSGEAIVQLGVPAGTKEADVEQFKTELKTFKNALSKFSADALDGTNDQLESSFSAVHDSFEMLAGMLPGKR
jgi:hypothetical protein